MNRRWKSSSRLSSRPLISSLVAAFVVALLGPAQTASAADGPALSTPVAVLDAALHCPATFAHPEREPVLLVHGTTTTYGETWEWGYTPALQADGYDVCGVDLPNRAMGDVQVSTEYVVNAVDRIHAATGRKVDVVGHSQGNMELRWAAKWWPHVRAEIDDMILLGNPGHGVTGGNLFCVGSCAPALHQFSMGSNFMAALNSTDETPGTVSYTSVYSRTDEAITPFTTASLSGATNIAVQDVCPGRVVTHFGLVYESVTYGLVKDALLHSGGADPGRLPFGKCLDVNLPGITAAEASTYSAVLAGNFSAEILNATKVATEPALKPYALS
ncbi:esterase/lipase family protein [Streptomyces venezuelae]|uniref:esterase/lipase family protein n=1 Tax=Streptomyces venezuelae TaxID=54571 RepID=UPI00362548A5